jgi:hypothetical protein
VVAAVSAAVVIAAIAVPSHQASRPTPPPPVVALLADGSLIEIPPNGSTRHLALAAATPPAPDAPHHVLALLPRHRLAALVSLQQTTELLIVDTARLRLLRRITLPSGMSFRSIAAGHSGMLYLFADHAYRGPAVGGTREEAPLIAALDPTRGKVLWTDLIRAPARHDWLVYRGLVSSNERRAYLSYHGPDTTGADWIALEPNGRIRRCRIPTPAGSGCITQAHGDIELDGTTLLATTGGPPATIIAANADGRVTSTWNSELTNNHLTELALDPSTHEVVALGSCAYAGGLSLIDTQANTVRLLAVPAHFPGLRRPVCGTRLAVAGQTVVIAGNPPQQQPDQSAPSSDASAIVYFDLKHARVIRMLKPSSAPVDLVVLQR